MKNRHQRGMALLIVLLLMSMMTAIAVNMNEFWVQAINRTGTLQFQQQAKWILFGVEARLKQQLDMASTSKKDMAKIWAGIGQSLHLDEHLVQIKIIDQQGCFNLNAINQVQVDSEEQKQSYPKRAFIQLLQNQGVIESEAIAITAVLSDWISEKSSSQNILLTKQRPSHRPLSDISEIRVLPKIDRNLYLKLLPFVCVLPEDTLKVNINALKPDQSPLLSALLLGEVTPEEAKGIIESRPDKGWGKIDEVNKESLSEQGQTAFTEFSQVVILTSDYWDILLWIEQDERYFQLTSLFKHDKHGFHIIQRHYGAAEY
ncbi:type II secretion system minor pseudopilin GspK [Yersinia enterocolitica]|uniref:type II secretion system minor pseudopilin GspK n=1 Tax=Yersinia enterocolitica TaxID=630 RepID=UPI001C8E0D07|nr:type II secretion system minor pseudopilin GspK [Yersinia enterocolitica]MBX9487359.1 type II secretion system minor pseudopilin GspK [Yersinia enterocolitica]MBX9490729.1 type II secretion system minor pseudopilin GspK [Yersinia enterocolitica]